MAKKDKELKKIQETAISRRKFLGMSGLAVGAAGMFLTGCGGDSNVDVYVSGGGSGNGGGSPLPSTWDGEADFVLIGYGGASAMAAIHIAKESPSSKIIILESHTAGGGSTKRCGGGTHLGAGTRLQVAEGFTETEADFAKYALAAIDEGGDSAMVEAFSKNTVATFAALEEAGVQYDGFSPAYGSSPAAGFGLVYDNEQRPELKEKSGLATIPPHAHFATQQTGHLGRGESLWTPLEVSVNALSNVDIIYSTKASGLIVNDEGRVVGVAAADGTKNYKANKAVFIGTGGFINNLDMVEQYIPHALACGISGAGSGRDMGDGIKMAQEIGADLKLMSAAEDFCPVFMENGNFVKAIAVNLTGERFAPEDLGGAFMGRIIAREYTGMPLTTNAIAEADKVGLKAWHIFDDNTFPVEALKNAFAKYSGATGAELAGKIGVNANILQATIDRYNQYVTEGVDHQFRKDPTMLQRIEAPYYAFPRQTSRVFTISCGGLRINDKSQVLNTKKEVIKGLYAAGAASSTIIAKYYMAGSGTAGAFVFGRIAGIEMTKENAWG